MHFRCVVYSPIIKKIKAQFFIDYYFTTSFKRKVKYDKAPCIYKSV